MSAATAADPSAAADKPKGKSKMLLMILVAVLVLGAAGAGAWYFLGQKKHEDAAHAEEAPAKRAAPTYMALENMVVNLADAGGERVAQIGITLELGSEKTADQVKALLPRIRSNLLVLISQRSSEELLKRDGKEKLAADIVAEVSSALGHEPPRRKKKAKVEDDEDAEDAPVAKARPRAEGPVTGVLFSSFIVQ